MFSLEFMLEKNLEVTYLGYILFAESFNVIYSNRKADKLKLLKNAKNPQDQKFRKYYHATRGTHRVNCKGTTP